MASKSTASPLKKLIVLWIVRLAGLLLALTSVLPLCIGWLLSKNKSNYWTPKKRTKPACLTDPSLGRHAFIQLKDVKLHYVEIGDRKKPLMLCLHGFPECWYSWKNQLRAFSKSHWVVAVDMKGYGESDKPQGGHHYQVPVLVEDVRQLILGLGKEKCILVAHDWGGVVGWTFAATYPEMLSHYVALNIPHGAVFWQHLTSSLKQIVSSWYMYVFQIPWIPELILQSRDNFAIRYSAKEGFVAGPNQKKDIEAYLYYYSQPGAWTPPVNYYRQLFGPSSCIWLSEEEWRIRVPTLLVFGKEDRFLDYRMVTECGKHVDNFRYELIEGASHWVQMDAADRTNTAVASFLKSPLQQPE